MGPGGHRLLDVQYAPDAERQAVSNRRLPHQLPDRHGPWPDSSFSVAAASNHPGGANVLFGDGSVKFIKDSIDRMTWWELGTRANGEVVSSDAY